MYTYTNLIEELKNKERSINDIIRFIGTRNDNNPNYSFLLGAGCSVTSNIESANQLITQWKREIYIQENPDIEIFEFEKAESYFRSEMWYDSRNPYSSLFEKKYDLPRQRRMFIEKSVRDKLPSIGYAYLIKLVESNYIKTIFTTNFDDLLNEAFYQYSNERPILCAHDSSINSITITSKRPKIIKLHGDYLFDDIKSTLRETESLEENIKNKFIEFSKDYGLVVVGYGGNDRSIIDILTYLLKNEEYFKNGIYWCMREDSIISEDLRKLLWKDRVFYVKIDGFDELMAETHANLNDNTLPIDSSYLSERKNEVINQLLSNSYFENTKCKYIKNDFERLNKAKDRDIISNFFQYLDQKEEDREERHLGFQLKKTKPDDINDSEKELLKNINEELFTSNYKQVNKIIDEKIEAINPERGLYKTLLSIKAKCLRNLNKKPKAIECYQELITIDKDEISNYIHLSNLNERFEDKLKWLESAIEIEPYISSLYYEKAKLLYNNYKDVYNEAELSYNLSSISKLIDKCLELSPLVNNQAWLLKFDLIKEINDDKERTITEFNEIIKKLENQDLYDTNLLKLKLRLMNYEDSESKNTLSVIEKCIPKQKRKDDIKEIEMIFLKELSRKKEKEKLKIRFEYLEKRYDLDNDYWEFKAKIQLEKFKSLDDAIITLKEIKVKNKSNYALLLDYLIYNQDFLEASRINEKYLGNDKFNQSQILTGEEKYEEALEIIRELKQKAEFDFNLNITESFLLLKLEKYQEAYNFTKKCLIPSNHTQPHFLVNYYIASKNFRGKVKPEKIKEKLLNGKKQTDIIEAAAYCLMEDYNKVKSKLNIIINNEYSYKYIIECWPLFDDYFKSSFYKKLSA